MTLVPGLARAATRAGILGAAGRAADRLPAIRSEGRRWEDVPYLVGLLLVGEQLEKTAPGAGRSWIDRAAAVVGNGDAPIANGDYAGYAQAAMDLYRLTPPADAARRANFLSATDGPFRFAAVALHAVPSNSPPLADWWVDGGYGTRFWVDDLFTMPPGLAMRGAKRDGLPGDAVARDLAYEWIEAYLYDHRPPSAGAPAADVPSESQRAGPFLWDPALSLFRHDPDSGRAHYWGRGNGWAAWGLSRSAGYLDTPYGGSRYDVVLDRTAIREVLVQFAVALTVRRSDDGGWPTDLAHPEDCPSSETSATGLITYMLAKGVNEGWLDRTAFTPVVLKAFSLLLERIDAQGDVSGIQPPGTGPDCGVTTSSDAAVDVSYGVGAFLLAASEVSMFPDADLATLEGVAARPVDRSFNARLWIVVRMDDPDALSPGPDDGEGFRGRRRPVRAVAVPLSTALAPGEDTARVEEREDFLQIGGRNLSPVPGMLALEIRSADGSVAEKTTLDLPAGRSAVVTRFVRAGSTVILSNASAEGGVVPVVVSASR